MLDTFWYFLLAAALLLFAVVMLPFRGGRRFLVKALPGLAFFLLLFAAAEVAHRFGVARGRELAEQGKAAPARVYTCSMHPQVRSNEPGLCPICHMELTLLGDVGPGTTIDPVVVQNMGVRVATVARGRLERSLRAFGSLRPAESRQHDVALKVDGFVEQLFADTEGMAIRRGEPLFSLYSPDLIVAQEELIAARKAGDAGLLAAARQKLQLWDLSEAEIDAMQQLPQARRLVTWPSPVDGVLLQKNVVAGAPAMKNQVLLRIVDLSVLWLDAQVPEQDLPSVQVGDRATATFAAMPGREVTGKVVFVAPTVEPMSRTGVVRLELPNDGGLKPGMFARLSLHQAVAEDAVLVPLEAVLDTGVRQLAWIAVGKGKFEPRPVRLGPAGDDGMVVVQDGLLAGDQVVLSGQFLIDSESRLREGSRKFSEQGLMPGGDLPPPSTLLLPTATQQQVDALLHAYLETTAAFVEDQHHADDWQAMTEAARALSTTAEPELQLPASELTAVLQQAGGDLVQMRVAFKQVSALATRLFEKARPSGQPDGKLFVLHCPMVDADWLQLDATVRNPYDTSMLSCGSVLRALPLRAPEAGK